jgi:hypothetical protein
MDRSANGARNPGSIRDWEDLLARVGAFARAVAFDMPGFGTADKPEEFDYSVLGYARHLGQLLDRLNVRRAHLVMLRHLRPWDPPGGLEALPQYAPGQSSTDFCMIPT